MRTHPSPPLQQRRLGAELRRLREGASISQRSAASHIDGAQGKLSKIETGRQSIRRLELLALLDLYGITDPEQRTNLVELLRPRPAPAWWHAYSMELSTGTLQMIELEDEADAVLEYGSLTVPDLLRTAEYAASLDREAVTCPTEAERALSETVRVHRREILDRLDGFRFTGVLDEAMLHRRVGSPSTMTHQLRHLLELSSLPHITIRVVPFARGGYLSCGSPFRLLDSSRSVGQSAVAVPLLTDLTCMTEADQVDRYRAAFDSLLSQALPPEQSAALITDLMKGYATTSGS
jgi:transcriptional regulator with XRE-family HTH domain